VAVKKEKIRHVSKLCKIDIEDNLDKYYQEFSIIMESVDKILNVDVDKDMLITPNQSINRFYKNESCQNLKTIDVKKVFGKLEKGYHVFKRWQK